MVKQQKQIQYIMKSNENNLWSKLRMPIFIEIINFFDSISDYQEW